MVTKALNIYLLFLMFLAISKAIISRYLLFFSKAIWTKCKILGESCLILLAIFNACPVSSILEAIATKAFSVA